MGDRDRECGDRGVERWGWVCAAVDAGAFLAESPAGPRSRLPLGFAVVGAMGADAGHWVCCAVTPPSPPWPMPNQASGGNRAVQAKQRRYDKYQQITKAGRHIWIIRAQPPKAIGPAAQPRRVDVTGDRRSPKPFGRITQDTRVILASFFGPICGDDHPCISRSGPTPGRGGSRSVTSAATQPAFAKPCPPVRCSRARRADPRWLSDL